MRQFLKRLSQVIVILFLTFTFLPYFLPVETNELAEGTKPFPNSCFKTINNTKFHYRIWLPDTGKIQHKVLMVHGFSSSTFCYRNNIKALTNAGAVVIAIDLPAFGFSDKSADADYSLDNVFALLNDLTDKYKGYCNEKYTVVGHSMGAAVISSYASNFPEKIKSVVLIDGTPVEWSKPSSFGFLLRCPPLCRWADVASRNIFNTNQRFTELLSSAYSREADTASVYGYMRPFLYKHSGSAILRMASANTNVKLNKEALQKLPLYIIWGDDDRWLSIKLMRTFLQKYPMAKTRIVKGAGHCPMETHASEVNEVLRTVIR